MTDPTTARDHTVEGLARAVEVLARRLDLQALMAAYPAQLDELEQIARGVRALAVAPTADVASARCQWCGHVVALTAEGLLVSHSEAPEGDPHVDCGGSHSDDHEVPDAIPAAAPEGDSTADVAAAIVEDEKRQHDALDDGWRPGHDYLRGYRAATERAAEIARECAAAPEGLDAADEQAKETPTTRALAEDGRRVRRERNAMVDELTAPQGAIQRVRAVCDETDRRAREMVGMFSGKKGADVPHWVGKIRRALDGDTTEEKR